MPAAPSLSIPPVVAQLASAAEEREVTGPGLLAALSAVPDPRDPRGVRHEMGVILALGLCAVLAGARSFTAIGEWAGAASGQVRAALGLGQTPPSEATIRRCLQRLSGDELDAAIGGWAAAGSHHPDRRRVVAVDGKTLCGSGDGAHQPRRHLMAAVDHRAAVALAQADVGAKTNEIAMFAQLCVRIDDLTGAVVTADAMHAQRAHAEYLVLERGAHYLLTVKGNQPALRQQLAALPWKQVPTAHTSTDRGHGRIESRSIKIVSVARGIVFPHAAQAIQITRQTRKPDETTWRTETVYAVTSLTAEQASPAELAAYIRGHCSIENRLQWVRDVTFDEDRSQVRTGNGPRVMASLRNLAIGLLRLTGATNIAQAIRHHAWNPLKPVTLLLTI